MIPALSALAVMIVLFSFNAKAMRPEIPWRSAIAGGILGLVMSFISATFAILAAVVLCAWLGLI